MKKNLHILILNWRDIKNPAGGGAEQLTHEMAKRWVLKGHTVTQFSAAFSNAEPKEVIDGITFIRKGRWWNVHILAFFFYIFSFRKHTDVIIDEVHWFPFFSYLYAPHKTIAFTCEVAAKLLFSIFPYPIALIFRGIEKMYLAIYKNVPTMVISPSTFADLIKTGHIEENVIILPMGLTIPKNLRLYPKEKNLTIISLGRLNKQKGSLDILEAFRIIHQKNAHIKFWIVGSGIKAYMDEFMKRVKEYKLTNAIKFFGFVSEQKKFELLARAHIIIGASQQEGWGLTVPEAGLVKTPAVVYNVQGLQDIIKQKRTGLLVNTTPQSLAEGILELVQNKKLYKIVQDGTYKTAKSYSWDKTADISLQFIKQNIK
jgi:glycosyltransferase involved in cell wall biosynthesis